MCACRYTRAWRLRIVEEGVRISVSGLGGAREKGLLKDGSQIFADDFVYGFDFATDSGNGIVETKRGVLKVWHKDLNFLLSRKYT